MPGSRVSRKSAPSAGLFSSHFQFLLKQWNIPRDRRFVLACTVATLMLVALIYGLVHTIVRVKLNYVVIFLFSLLLALIVFSVLRGHIKFITLKRREANSNTINSLSNDDMRERDSSLELNHGVANLQLEKLLQTQNYVENDYSSIFSERLSRDQAKLTEALDLYGQSITDRLNMAGVSLARDFRDRGDELQKRLEAVGEKLAASISRQADAAITTMNASASEIEQRFAMQLNNIKDVFSTPILNMSDSLIHHFDALFTQIENMRNSVSSVTASGGQEFHEHLKHITLAIDERITDANLSLQQLVENALDRIDSRVNARLTDFEARLRDVDQKSAAQWEDQIERHVARVSQTAADSYSKISTELEGIGLKAATEARSALLKGVQSPLRDLTSFAAEIGARINKAASDTAESLSRFDAQSQAFATALTDANENLSRVILHQGVSTREMIEYSLTNIASTFEAGRNSLTASISDTTKRNAEILASELERHQRLVEARISEANRLLEGADRQWTDAISRAAASADSLLSTRGSDVVRAIEVETERVASHLDVSSTKIIRGVERLTESLDANFSSLLSELQRILENGNAKMQHTFALPLIHTVTRLESESTALAKTAQLLIDSFVQTSTSQQDVLRGIFVKEANNLTALVTSNADLFRRQFESTIASADDIFLSRGLDVARELAARVDELRRLLTDEGHTLLRDFESRGDHLARQVEAVSQRSLGDFERKTTGLIALLTRRGDDLLSAMTAAASESARMVSQISHEQQQPFGKAEIGRHRSRHELVSNIAVGGKPRGEDVSGALLAEDDGRESSANFRKNAPVQTDTNFGVSGYTGPDSSHR